MNLNFSFGKGRGEVTLGAAQAARQRETGDPFILAVIGDFSGRASRGCCETLAGRRFWRIHTDNFAQVFAAVAPRLRLNPGPAGQAELQLEFSSLEDFHPDRVLQTVPALKAMLATRARLLNPTTAAAAAAELGAGAAPLPGPELPAAPTAAGGESHADTMERLLGGAPPPTQASPGAAAAPKPGIDQFLKRLVSGSIVPGTTPTQAAMVSAMEMEISRELRAVLHHPGFQALEACWRGIEWLVRDFGAEDNLKLMLVDVSREELAADLSGEDYAAISALGKLLRREADQAAWTLAAALYDFGATVPDLDLLGRLAGIAALHEVPFLAAGSPRLVGCESFGASSSPEEWTLPVPEGVAAAWQALRGRPEASRIALAMPRFLLRQPYGERSDAIAGFNFDELGIEPAHEAFLWGHPALACAHLLAGAFQSEGWDMSPGATGDIGDLPWFSYDEAGETVVKPCAEAWLGERACRKITEAGITPLQSIRGQNAVRVAGLQALSGAALAL